MYYTITLNPAVDMLTKVENFSSGKLNRAEEASYIVGGKGINISILLKNIGKESTAFGFVGGFTGKYIKQKLTKIGINHDFIETSGNTRINIKLKTDTETEINTQSSKVSREEIEELIKKLEILDENDTVFLSGNIISGMSTDDFVKVAQKITEKKSKLIIDSNKDLVLKTLQFNPFIVKPNTFELGEIFGIKIKSEKELIIYAKKLQQLGAKNVLVSQGADGALLITQENKIYKVGVAKGKIISTVAAGDSMLAMFIATYDETKCFKQALRYSSAAGAATSFSIGIGKQEQIKQLVTQIEVTNIKI